MRPVKAGLRRDALISTSVRSEDGTAAVISAHAMNVVHVATADVTLTETVGVLNSVGICIGDDIEVGNVHNAFF